MQPILSRSVWLSLDKSIREQLARIFEMTKSGVSEVINDIYSSRIVCDGFIEKDLMCITVEKLQNFLNSEESDFYKLFNEAIENIKKLNSVGIETLSIKKDEPIKEIHTEVQGRDEAPKAGKVNAGTEAKRRGKKNA